MTKSASIADEVVSRSQLDVASSAAVSSAAPAHAPHVDHDVTKPALLEHSLAYAAQGFAVFPLHNPLAGGRCSCGDVNCGKIGKHPRTSNGLKAATTDSEQIQSWWTASPEANIGLATGAVSGVMVIDIDGAEGEESLRRMTERYSPLPATRTATTGRGRHLFFRHPGEKAKSRAPICAEYPHIDSRGDGGYVVAAPSLHSSGVRYAEDPTMPSELANAPGWLVDLINGERRDSAAAAIVASNDALPEGSRNAALTSLAGTMRRRGMTQEAIEAALLAENTQRCNPALPEDEVRAIARSISNYTPGDPADVVRTLTDRSNAERFAAQWGKDVRFIPELKNWIVWNGNHWQQDAVGTIMEMAKRTAFDIYDEGASVTDSHIRDQIARHSKLSQQAPRLKAMLDLAKSIPALVIPITELDADPWLLGVANGTLDLRKGCLLPAKREHYITKAAPVAFDPAAQCPRFLEFLDDIMAKDQGLVAYWQRVFGYMLTGVTTEDRLFFLYGTGANGKSTLLGVCKGLLGGELCRQTPVETIMAGARKSGATPELACLNGARAVITTEVDEGSFLSESLVKQMTGGDYISARPLYGVPFDFLPSFKLFVAGNHKPVIRGGDDGIWRRIDMIPFEVTVPTDKRDPELGEKLRAELPGILNWALEGCSAWQRRRLDSPAAVVDAVTEYKEDMDILGQWLAQCCEVGSEFTAFGSNAYDRYKMWAELSGLKPWSSPIFGRKLKEKYRTKRTNVGVCYRGFRLIESSPSIVKAKVAPV